MRRVIWSLAIVLALVAGVSAQTVQYLTFEPITVAGSAIGLTITSVVSGNGHPQANYALCRVESNQIRYMVDASALTASRGTIAAANDILQFSGNQTLQNLRFIATGASATLNCTYADARWIVP